MAANSQSMDMRLCARLPVHDPRLRSTQVVDAGPTETSSREVLMIVSLSQRRDQVIV